MAHSRIGRGREKRGNASPPKTGTALAIKAKAMSSRLSDGKHGLTGSGRHRNRADRTSCALSLSQVDLLIGAAQFAQQIGLPLNRHITVHWQAAGIPDSEAAAATSNLIKRASDWVKYSGASFAAAWVRENDNGDGSKGPHVHILAHVPAALSQQFFVMLRRWLKAIRTTARHERGTLHTRCIGGTARAAETNPAFYRANLSAVLAYIIKGASEPAAKAFHLERLEDGGTVIGKRAGTTQNIGRAAWRHASAWSFASNTRAGGANGKVRDKEPT